MDYDKIMYLLLEGSNITAVDKDNNKTIISKDELDNIPEYFKQVHKDCIVNTNKVIEYNWAKSYFILENGAIVNYLSKKLKES